MDNLTVSTPRYHRATSPQQIPSESRSRRYLFALQEIRPNWAMGIQPMGIQIKVMRLPQVTRFDNLPQATRNVIATAIRDGNLNELIRRWLSTSVVTPSTPLLLTASRTVWTDDGWSTIRERIESFADLPENWDSYGAEPISADTLSAALELVDSIGEAGGQPDWVEATADSTILLQHRLNENVLKWEIDDSDEAAVVITKPTGEKSFYDIATDNIENFLLGLNERD
jgi:hypothetical protein